MAEKKKMTVAEMIAAARKSDSKGGAGGGATPSQEAAPAETSDAAATENAAEPAPAAKPVAPAKDPKKMSVAEMIAAAKAEKAAGAKPAPVAAATPKAEASPKPAAAAKPAATTAKQAAAAKSVPAEKDTASILAAVRKTAKPGPVSKSEVVAEKAPVKKKLEVPPMPEKPAYARPRPAAPAAAAQQDRRGFMALLFGSSLAIGFTSLAVTNVLWVLGLARFMFPNVLIEPPTKFKVGFRDDFAPGQVSEKFKAQFGVWIVRYEFEGEPMIFALKTVCTHLGCTPNWLEGEQKFKCPCHGSGFYKDGINFEGPAPRPLERYAIAEVDGMLEVDKSATFNEETGQWSDPASFVPV